MVQTYRLNEIPLIGIIGPTAVGKSSVAMDLAEKLDTSIISADSMQIYKGFDIGTAKPSIAEQNRVHHFMIDIVNPSDYYSSLDYRNDVDKIVLNNFKDKTPLLVGGTGFYFDSVLYENDFDNSVDENKRQELQNYLQRYGKEKLHELLRSLDPVSAENIHPNNTKRVIRAIEIFQTTGIKKSQGNGLHSQKRYNCILFELFRERYNLYKRINDRVDIMINKGLIEEVSNLLEIVSPNTQSMQGIGYKEIVPYLEGKCSKEEAINNIKQNSRNYAKRQISYFKRLNTIKINAEQNEINIINQIESYINIRG